MLFIHWCFYLWGSIFTTQNSLVPWIKDNIIQHDLFLSIFIFFSLTVPYWFWNWCLMVPLILQNFRMHNFSLKSKQFLGKLSKLKCPKKHVIRFATCCYVYTWKLHWVCVCQPWSWRHPDLHNLVFFCLNTHQFSELSSWTRCSGSSVNTQMCRTGCLQYWNWEKFIWKTTKTCTCTGDVMTLISCWIKPIEVFRWDSP